MSLADAVALVDRVRASAERGAREGLRALADAVPVPIASIALRRLPLPSANDRRAHRRQSCADRSPTPSCIAKPWRPPRRARVVGALVQSRTRASGGGGHARP